MTRYHIYAVTTGAFVAQSYGWVPHFQSHIITPAIRKELPRREHRLSLKDEKGGPLEYDDFQDFVGESFDSTFAPPSTEKSQVEKTSSAQDDLPPLQFDNDDDDATTAEVVPLPKLVPDRSACRTRRFALGPEIILDRYLGTLGFQEVTDWQYYMTDQDEDGQTVGDRRDKVSPNPLDPSQPRRTRQSSGSILRIFRAELVGALGGLLRSQGVENRVLIKEFSGQLGLALAEQESKALAQFQSSKLVEDDDDEDWRNDAMTRTNNPRSDNMRLLKMIKQAPKCPFTVFFGEVDLGEVEDEGWDANEFYRAMGVEPPKPGAVWHVYEYTGVGASAMRLTQASPTTRWQNLPKGKGFFGNPIDPPALPAWSERAAYLMKGIVGPALKAIAETHAQGIVHRSLGVTSLLVLPRTMTDKAAALSPLWTNIRETVVKFSDWGFSERTDPDILLQDDDFVRRARSFDINLSKASPLLLVVNFALAEDMHALGVAIVQLLLSTLAEPLDPNAPLPPIASNEDSFQRVWTDIYDQDMSAFRDYLRNEDDDIYKSLVSYLDEKDGWQFLDALLNARERVAQKQQAESIVSVEQLLQSPLFS